MLDRHHRNRILKIHMQLFHADAATIRQIDTYSAKSVSMAFLAVRSPWNQIKLAKLTSPKC